MLSRDKIDEVDFLLRTTTLDINQIALRVDLTYHTLMKGLFEAKKYRVRCLAESPPISDPSEIDEALARRVALTEIEQGK